jgi:hypothetical protein
MYLPGLALFHRFRAGCLVNLPLKVVAVVIAVILHVLMRRAAEEPAPEPPPAACSCR